jgi:hypothetical protein
MCGALRRGSLEMRDDGPKWGRREVIPKCAATVTLPVLDMFSYSCIAPRTCWTGNIERRVNKLGNWKRSSSRNSVVLSTHSAVNIALWALCKYGLWHRPSKALQHLLEL